jgi:2-oxoisovalerate dehydrogenase E2 component (dihydrolipoyl transacylase)
MSEHIFKLPDLGEGMVEAEISEWMVKVGDFIEEEDVFGAVMTDKAAVELSAPVSGKVKSLAGEPGDMVAVGAALITFETSGDSVADDTTESSEESAAETGGNEAQALPTAQAESAVTPVTSGKVLTSPSIRQHAREAGIDLTRIQGSGPRGRILKSDLGKSLTDGIVDTASKGKTPAPATAVTEIKVIGLRRIIAERMSEANREVPHFAYVEEVDVTALESLRKHLNSKKAQGEDRLTLLPFISMALTRALANFPQCNALYDREKNVISQYQAVNLGVATQTPTGLKVPVVKNCEARGLNDLAAEIRRVSNAARDNTAKSNELTGSTISITSLGKVGGIVTTPIINLPEVAIIGVNKAVERPVVVDGNVVVRLMMNLSSSFDHRFVDGYDAAMMIQQVKELLEQPATMFMDL